MSRSIAALALVLAFAGCASAPRWSPHPSGPQPLIDPVAPPPAYQPARPNTPEPMPASPRATPFIDYPQGCVAVGAGFIIPTDKSLDAGLFADLDISARPVRNLDLALRLQATDVGVGQDFAGGRYEGDLFAFKILPGVRAVLPVRWAEVYAGGFAGWRVNSGDIHFRDFSVELVRSADIHVSDGLSLQGVVGVQARPTQWGTFGMELGLEYHRADLTITERDAFTGALIPGAGVTVKNAILDEVLLRFFAAFTF
jgi:hypothetical protein